MASSYSYSVGFIVLVVASILVVAQNDPCSNLYLDKDCLKCVVTKFNDSKTCVHFFSPNGGHCAQVPDTSEGASIPVYNVSACENAPTTIAPPANTTTAPPTTTSSTTTLAPPTNATTTLAPPTNATTTLAPPTNATTTVTPTVPSTTTISPNTTTPTPGPTPTPSPRSGGGMSVGSFFAGIAFTLTLSALGYIIWRFYKARMDRNYHTFSNPTF